MYPKITSAKQWVIRYERHLTSLALATGFIIDNLTLKRIDLPFENLIFTTYFFIAGICILTLHIVDSMAYKTKMAERFSLWVPFILQFAFGGLFSGFTVFYSRSGSIVASWPFLFILVGLLVGNELMKKRYEQLIFQITVYFIAFFFFFIFLLPVLLGHMGPWIFVLSGVASLIVITLFIYLLYRVSPMRTRKSLKFTIISIASVFLLINLLYFTHIIPPIPLSLKSAGVYHSIVQVEENFTVKEEKSTFKRLFEVCNSYHVKKGQPLYVYSSVFAPTRIKTEIIHNWQYLSPQTNRWVSATRIPFEISGGRAQGYRGYSFKSNLTEGCWRVDVETPQGQVIGRIRFGVKFTDNLPELMEVIL
jgi:hypothetical protein